MSDDAAPVSREAPIGADVRGLHARVRTGQAPPAFEGPRDSETLTGARATRRELYILLSVCASQMVPDFIDATPPGSVQPVELDNEPSAAFHDALLAVIDRFFERHADEWRDGRRRSEIEPLLRRIDAIGPGVSAVDAVPRFHYAEGLVKAGMRSMAVFAPVVVSAIIDRAADPSQATEIARRSVLLLRRLASLGLGDRTQAQERLIDEDTVECRPGAPVALSGPPGQERLELDVPAVLCCDPPPEWRLPASYGFVIGCPALIRLEGEAPLDRLWNWMLDAAELSGYRASRSRRVSERPGTEWSR